jgi:hypothetical protein
MNNQNIVHCTDFVLMKCFSRQKIHSTRKKANFKKWNWNDIKADRAYNFDNPFLKSQDENNLVQAKGDNRL